MTQLTTTAAVINNGFLKALSDAPMTAAFALESIRSFGAELRRVDALLRETRENVSREDSELWRVDYAAIQRKLDKGATANVYWQRLKKFFEDCTLEDVAKWLAARWATAWEFEGAVLELAYA